MGRGANQTVRLAEILYGTTGPREPIIEFSTLSPGMQDFIFGLKPGSPVQMRVDHSLLDEMDEDLEPEADARVTLESFEEALGTESEVFLIAHVQKIIPIMPYASSVDVHHQDVVVLDIEDPVRNIKNGNIERQTPANASGSIMVVNVTQLHPIDNTQ